MYFDHQRGQLRFRLTKTKNPDRSFKIGKDLLLPDGRPWHSFPRWSQNSKESAFTTFLRQGLPLKSLHDDGLPNIRRRRIEVHKFGEPFAVRLSSRWINVRNSTLHPGPLGGYMFIRNPLSFGTFPTITHFFKGKRTLFHLMQVLD